MTTDLQDPEDAIPGEGLPTVLPIRLFPMGAVVAGINQAVAQIPPGSTACVVAYVDQDGGHFAAAAKLGEHWSFMGHLDKPWDGRLEIGAGVQWHN